MNIETKDRYIANFRNVEAGLPGQAISSIKNARRQAMEMFASRGFPATHDEEWKYTSVATLERRAFSPALPKEHAITASSLADWTFTDMACHLMVFVDGFFAPNLSQIGELPAGAIVTNTAEMFSRQPQQFTRPLGSGTDFNVFESLNTALMTDGAYIYVSRGMTIDRPIHVLFVTTTHDCCCHLRNVLVAEENAHMTLIEHHVGIGEISYFSNPITTIEVGNSARVDHYKLQQEEVNAFHIATICAKQGRDSVFNSHSLAIGAGLSRNDIKSKFLDVGGECQLNGLYVVTGQQHVDHHTYIDHAQPNCVSREYYRGVLNGSSRAVFNGKVIVRQDAQKTDAQQANHNLLLSNDAEVDTKPELQIYADDVKCTHGATIGQIDEDMLFYFRSRGISKEIAYGLLTYAFAHDIVDRIELQALRERLERILTAQLPRGGEIKGLI